VPSRHLAIARTIIVPLLIVLGWAGVIFVFQPFGHRLWSVAAITALLMCLAFGTRLKTQARASSRLDRPRRGSPRLARTVFIGVPICWLGLIAWSSLSPGGAMPPIKPDAEVVRVVTWNILCGSERGMPWSRHGWAVRKEALRSSLETIRPDVLCVQEALPEQVEAVEGMLPGHRRVGVGRDDGRSAGEHCAIYFDSGRFQELGGGTFWLEEPADEPPSTTLLGPKRICTWVRLRDQRSGRCVRVYNLHLYLTESARLRSDRLIRDWIASGDPTDAVLVAGDFNATPDASSRRLFEEWGLKPSAELAGASPRTPTYQFYGIRFRSLDEILVNHGWRVVSRRVLDMKPGNTFPSDHFGVMADLILRDVPSTEASFQRNRSAGRCKASPPVGPAVGKVAAQLGTSLLIARSSNTPTSPPPAGPSGRGARARA
jgi:endonuclease/exonuclease/phosphatase family metal-dependent hydrolase